MVNTNHASSNSAQSAIFKSDYSKQMSLNYQTWPVSNIYWLILIELQIWLSYPFFLSGGSQEGADLVAPDVSEFGLSKCSFQQQVTLLFLSYSII